MTIHWARPLPPDKIMLAGQVVDKIMLGTGSDSIQVWPTGPWFCTDFTKGKLDKWVQVNGTSSFSESGLKFGAISGDDYSAISRTVNLNNHDVFKVRVEVPPADTNINLILGPELYAGEALTPSSIILNFYENSGYIYFSDSNSNYTDKYIQPLYEGHVTSFEVFVYKINNSSYRIEVRFDDVLRFSELVTGAFNFETIRLSSDQNGVIAKICVEETTAFDVAQHLVHNLTTVGTHSLPAPNWAVGLAAATLGGGGGGGGGDGAISRTGTGGNAGNPASRVTALGSGHNVTVDVGAGGNAGAKEKAGGPGGISRVYNLGSGVSEISAPAASGGSGYNGTPGYGNPYPVYVPTIGVVLNLPTIPTSANAGNNTNGNIPGGGGGPGTGGIFGGGNPGRAGGRGQVIVVFYDQKTAEMYGLPS